MRTTTASVLVLCLTAGVGAAQEHGTAPAEGAKAVTKTDASAPAAHGGAHEAPKPPATKPSHASEDPGKATAQAVPPAGKSTASKPKTAVLEPPISETDRHAADAAKAAHKAASTKSAAVENGAPARVPVDELAVRLQRVLDAEASRKTGGRLLHEPPAKAATATRKAYVAKAPPPETSGRPTRPAGVALNWGSASVAMHVTLTWEFDVDHRQPPLPTPTGARLSWEAEHP
jgi:hypothetical protein